MYISNGAGVSSYQLPYKPTSYYLVKKKSTEILWVVVSENSKDIYGNFIKNISENL